MAAPSDPFAATSRFYSITELLELVLMHLPVESIVTTILADTGMRRTILGCPALRRKLHLRDSVLWCKYAEHACVLIQAILAAQPYHIALRLRWDLPYVQHLIFSHPSIANLMGWRGCPSRRHLTGVLGDLLQNVPKRVALRVPFIPQVDDTRPSALFQNFILDSERMPSGLETRLNLDFLTKTPTIVGGLLAGPQDPDSLASGPLARNGGARPYECTTKLHPNFDSIFSMSRWLCIPVTEQNAISWHGCRVPAPRPKTRVLKLFVMQREVQGDHSTLEDYTGELWTQMNVTSPPRDIVLYPIVTDQLGAQPFVIPRHQATMGQVLDTIEAHARPAYTWEKLSSLDKGFIRNLSQRLTDLQHHILYGRFAVSIISQVSLPTRRSDELS